MRLNPNNIVLLICSLMITLSAASLTVAQNESDDPSTTSGQTEDERLAEMLALVGPSGCGKSTMLNLVAAVDRSDGGRVTLCGVDLAHATETDLVTLRRRRIGIRLSAG